jgi:hypothetical protein
MRRYQLNFASAQKANPIASSIRILVAAALIALIALLAAREAGKALRNAAAIKQSGQNRISASGIERIRQQTATLQFKWKKRLNMINNLLAAKNSGLLSFLDELEKTMPDGVFVSHLKYAGEKRGVLELTINSPNSNDLLKAYSGWRQHHLSILRENEQGGLITSQLTLNFEAGDHEK